MKFNHMNLFIIITFVTHQAFATSRSSGDSDDIIPKPRLIEDDLRAAVGIMTENQELRQRNIELVALKEEQESRFRQALRGVRGNFDQFEAEKAELNEAIARLRDQTVELEKEASRQNTLIGQFEVEKSELRDQVARLEDEVEAQSLLIAEVKQEKAESERDWAVASRKIIILQNQMTECKDNQLKQVFKNAALLMKNEQLTKEITATKGNHGTEPVRGIPFKTAPISGESVFVPPEMLQEVRRGWGQHLDPAVLNAPTRPADVLDADWNPQPDSAAVPGNYCPNLGGGSSFSPRSPPASQQVVQRRPKDQHDSAKLNARTTPADVIDAEWSQGFTPLSAEDYEMLQLSMY